MKPHIIITTILAITSILQAEEICHFNKANVPSDERRLLELSKVFEMRCDYATPPLEPRTRGTQFVAERYQGGKCVSRQYFADGTYHRKDMSDVGYAGTISFGWNMTDQTLIGFHDMGYLKGPTSIKLEGFNTGRPTRWSFFKDSRSEPRTVDETFSFKLFPIAAIQGGKKKSRDVVEAGRDVDTSSFSQEELTTFYKNLPDSVIIYLSRGASVIKPPQP